MKHENGANWKIVIRILAFACVLVFLLIEASYLLRPRGFEHDGVTGLYAEKENSLDVICIGGSDVFRFYSPLQAYHERGYTSYNLAVSSMSPLTLKYFIAEALRTQPNATLVVSLRGFQYGYDRADAEGIRIMYSNAPLRRFTDSMRYSLRRYEAIEYIAGHFPDLKRAEYHFDIIKYHSRWNELTRDSFKYKDLSSRDSYYKRFLLSSVHTMLEKVDVSQLTEQTRLVADIDIVLKELLEYCSTLENVKLLFVIPPCLMSEDMQMKFNYIGFRVKEYGMDFINFNDCYSDIGLDFTADFYDNDHLNVCGSEKYTAYLSALLDDKYNLPDKRNDPAYAAWADDYERMELEAAGVRTELQEKLKQEGLIG